jgi:hypothetical protein
VIVSLPILDPGFRQGSWRLAQTDTRDRQLTAPGLGSSGELTRPMFDLGPSGPAASATLNGPQNAASPLGVEAAAVPASPLQALMFEWFVNVPWLPGIDVVRM